MKLIIVKLFVSLQISINLVFGASNFLLMMSMTLSDFNQTILNQVNIFFSLIYDSIFHIKYVK